MSRLFPDHEFVQSIIYGAQTLYMNGKYTV